MFLNGGRIASGGGVWEKVSETLIGSAVDYVDFTSLNLEEDNVYKFLIHWVNGVAGAGTMYLYYNGDTTATNYYTELINGSGNSAVAQRANNPTIAYTKQSSEVQTEITITKVPGLVPKATSFGVMMDGTDIENRIVGHWWTTTNNVTTIRLGGTTNLMGVGTHIALLKLAL